LNDDSTCTKFFWKAAAMNDLEPPVLDDSSSHAQIGDLALLAGPRQKNFTVRLMPGEKLETHRGILYHDDLIGQTWGTQVYSHVNRSFILLQPSLSDLLMDIRRNTQIMYPKDIGMVIMMMNIGPGQQVLEAGTGSGALTTALAYLVGPQGRVTTYEARPEMQKLARKNLARVGLADRVEFKSGNVADGFAERGVDALFLDLPNPYDYLPQVREALKAGGFFGTLLPTTNQVAKLLVSLNRERFSFVEVCEVLLRFYQVHPDRLRPTDRMVAHTGYLIFARPVQHALPVLEEAGEAARGEDSLTQDEVDPPLEMDLSESAE
jgi:tRNA (adenine57-N1/adenine58-N1)-methyltransferase catalytic subunit